MTRSSYGDRGVVSYDLAGDDPRRIVKLADAADPYALLAEVDRLDWIDGRLSAPRVLASEPTDSGGHAAVLEIPAGTSIDAAEHRIDGDGLARAVGESLAAIHALDVSGCPFRSGLDVRLRAIRRRVNVGAYDAGLFSGSFRGRNPVELLALVERSQPDEDDLVFTHGRFRPASLLRNDLGEIVVLDWAHAGVADRHVDLAATLAWVAEHLGGELAPRVLDAYGLAAPDLAKLDYYAVLGQFA